MKRIASIFTLMMIAIVAVNAQGLISTIKERVTIGVKAEAKYSNFILSDMADTKSTMGIGGNLGASIKFNISKNFFIQEDILFTYSTSEYTQKGVKDTYQYF